MPRFLFLLIFFFISPFWAQQPHSVRAKIYFDNAQQLQKLIDAGIAIDHGIRKENIFILSDYSSEDLAKAKKLGSRVETIIPDLEKHYSNRRPIKNGMIENTCPGIIDFTTPANYRNGSMGGFLTYQEILDELDKMASLYPNLITARTPISDFKTEGDQPENYNISPGIGGNSIFWVKISDNPAAEEQENEILYTSLHHAREPLSAQELIFYMWYLLENYATDDEVKFILDNTALFFVPVVNPDGYLYNQFTHPDGGGNWRKNRKNGYGVDNNRNYNYYINGNPNNGTWGGEGASSSLGSEIYHGPSPFSEIENQAIKWFVEQHDFKAAMNSHTTGNYLLFPLGYENDVYTPDYALYLDATEFLIGQNGFDNKLSSELYPAAGDSDDFMYGTIGTQDTIFAMTPEIGREFWPEESQIENLCKQMVYTNLKLARMVNTFAFAKETTAQFIDAAHPEIKYELTNLSLKQPEKDFTVSIEPLSSNLNASFSTNLHENMSTGEKISGELTLNLKDNINPGERIAFNLVIINELGFKDRQLIEKTFGKSQIQFNPEDSAIVENYSSNGWQTTTTDFYIGENAITDSPDGNYGSGDDKTITTLTPIDLSNALGAQITFWAKWEIEDNWDFVQFEVSTDGGNSWIAQCGKHTEPGSENGFQPAGEPVYDSTQANWVQEIIDLSDYLGEEIMLRFRLRSDEAVEEDGFYFDDLTVSIIPDNSFSIDETHIDQFTVFPNPVKDNIKISNIPQNASLSIYDIQGKLIKSHLLHQELSSVDLSYLDAGVYILELTSTDLREKKKIIKL